MLLRHIPYITCTKTSYSLCWQSFIEESAKKCYKIIEITLKITLNLKLHIKMLRGHLHNFLYRNGQQGTLRKITCEFILYTLHIQQLFYIHNNCSTFTATVLHSQQLFYIHNNCSILTATVLYLQQLFYVYNNCSMFTATVLHLQQLFYIYCNCYSFTVTVIHSQLL